MPITTYLTLVLWQCNTRCTLGLSRLSRDVCMLDEAKIPQYTKVVYFIQPETITLVTLTGAGHISTSYTD